MTLPTTQQVEILRIINHYEEGCSWYQFARGAFDIISEYPELKISNFVKLGLIEERDIEGEPLPRLFLTEKGKEALTSKK